MKVKLSGIRSVAITSEFIRLDSLLKLATITGTGGEAKQIILSGGVRLNGEECLMRGKKIRPGDVVHCMGETIKVRQRGDG